MKKVKLFDLENDDQLLAVATTDDDGMPCIENTLFHCRDELMFKMTFTMSYEDGEHDLRDEIFTTQVNEQHAQKVAENLLNILNENQP